MAIPSLHSVSAHCMEILVSWRNHGPTPRTKLIIHLIAEISFALIVVLATVETVMGLCVTALAVPLSFINTRLFKNAIIWTQSASFAMAWANITLINNIYFSNQTLVHTTDRAYAKARLIFTHYTIHEFNENLI